MRRKVQHPTDTFFEQNFDSLVAFKRVARQDQTLLGSGRVQSQGVQTLATGGSPVAATVALDLP